MDLRVSRSQYHLEILYRVIPHLYVVFDCILENGYILVNDRDRSRDYVTGISLARFAVEKYLAAPGLIET